MINTLGAVELYCLNFVRIPKQVFPNKKHNVLRRTRRATFVDSFYYVFAYLCGTSALHRLSFV